MKREPQGLIYTILIEDKAVAALQARGSEARELCREEWFLEELSRLKSNGEPLYRPGFAITCSASHRRGVGQVRQSM